MKAMTSSESAAELYVHAMAIEREAAERYAELAARMDDEGNFAVAELFRLFSTLEAKHLGELRRRAANMELPPLGADYSWRDGAGAETVRLDAHGGALTQQKALSLALQAEKGARAFFENASRICEDADTRALAREMAAEEQEHVMMIERMLEGDLNVQAHPDSARRLGRR
jgi:rubrerythrin